ncbi:MAG: BamA/TamA family outer membrane protein [Polyangiaceae bacterium]
MLSGALVLSPRRASAQVSGYSALEQSVVSQKLSERGLELEPLPEGKRIEEVQVITLDVFDERDLAQVPVLLLSDQKSVDDGPPALTFGTQGQDASVPDFVNALHATTREQVIRRELLFEPGEPYRAAAAHETARNLRELRQLSIVLIVPTRGSAPDRVRVLVITKDVWSLRLNWALQSSNGHINSLALNPSEENLLGTHAVIGGLFVLDPATYSLGLSLSHRRLFGSHELAVLSANFIRNRDTGAAEGSFGEFRYGQPLYSLDTKWSWGTSILWRHDIARYFLGVNIAKDKKTGIPLSYDRDDLYGGYELVRSFGRRFKYDLSFGVEAVRGVARNRDLSAYSQAAVASFSDRWLPVSDQRVSPFVQLHAHRTDFSSSIEIETLGLQEDFRRGHDLLLRAYAASSAVGSTRDLVGTLSQLSYTFPIGDGLLRPVAAARLESASQGRDDALLEARLRFVSPRLGFGRLILDGQLEDRVRNYLHRQFSLGGDGRLRGYQPGAAIGPNVIAATAELRTSSIDLFSAQLGGAAFYDVADAPEDFGHINLRQGAGVGLRILFPEFDRIVFRADWGFPLSPGYSTFPGVFSVSFKQAFSMPAVAAPSVLTETL